MKQIDITLKGVVNGGYDAQSASLTMFVTQATLNNNHGSKWHFPLPPLVMVPLKDLTNLTPEDKYALSITGSEVHVQVSGEPDDLKVVVVAAIGRTRRTLDEFVTTIENCAAKSTVEQIDVVICGVVNNGYKRIDEKLGTFKMFVSGAILDNRNESRWHFSLPPLVSIHVRDSQKVSPFLKITGTEVLVHVLGKPDNLKVKVVFAQKRDSYSLKKFISCIDECAPECSVKIHIDGDFKAQNVRMDA